MIRKDLKPQSSKMEQQDKTNLTNFDPSPRSGIKTNPPNMYFQTFQLSIMHIAFNPKNCYLEISEGTIRKGVIS